MGTPKPKNIDVTKSFTISGVKDIGDYTYCLLIDGATDLALIKRIKTDNSEIKFLKIDKGSGELTTKWASPDATGMNYVWIHQI